jgi:hypothetical protein
MRSGEGREALPAAALTASRDDSLFMIAPAGITDYTPFTQLWRVDP